MTGKNEETRKVQRLGSSTLALSLPAEWVAEQGIEKGDALTIRRNSTALSVLSPTTPERDTEAVIEADSLDAETVERLITAQYVLGRRVITVEVSEGNLSNEVVNAVYRTEGRLMGLGVIEEVTDHISIRCSIDPEDFDLNALVERLENTGTTMRENAIKGFAYGNPDLAQRAVDREEQADKIFALLLRLLSTADGDPSVAMAIGLEDPNTLVGYRSLVENLELIADEAERIAEAVMGNADHPDGIDESTVAEIRAFADRVDELSSMALRAFLDRDYELTMKARSSFRRVGSQQSEIIEATTDLPADHRRLVHELLVALYTSAQYAMRNAEIAVDANLNDDESEFVTVR